MPADDLATLEKRARQLLDLFENTVIERWPDFRDQVSRSINTLDGDLVRVDKGLASLRSVVEREAASRPVQQAKLDGWRNRQESYLIGLGVAVGLLLFVRLIDLVRATRDTGSDDGTG